MADIFIPFDTNILRPRKIISREYFELARFLAELDRIERETDWEKVMANRNKAPYRMRTGRTPYIGQLLRYMEKPVSTHYPI